MEPSVLHSQVSEFEERNSFLYFVLGLISLSRTFIHLLETEQDGVKLAYEQLDENMPNEEPSTNLRDLLI